MEQQIGPVEADLPPNLHPNISDDSQITGESELDVKRVPILKAGYVQSSNFHAFQTCLFGRPCDMWC